MNIIKSHLEKTVGDDTEDYFYYKYCEEELLLYQKLNEGEAVEEYKKYLFG